MSETYEMAEEYIIIAYNSEGAISVRRLLDIRENVKCRVLEMILEDKRNDIDKWDMGTDSVLDFDYVENGNGFSGFNTFVDYSINYVAYPYHGIPTLEWGDY